ncbi:uncharacterized protein LY79DRAFT_186801 [Colletotrichum navitas]|uniref:Uncharacterized protein n=1 Tax=Colletotrichum navitas TaxID=681940 RepID=A0AAD8V620_9PEZI|nr:uncharacterized protein LY79DRAFT_186801 [Colletotrichum navitas]KAK1593091.1 hypothetical protein LY79DRAFT_186801 [Colletotrichum navitas]
MPSLNRLTGVRRCFGAALGAWTGWPCPLWRVEQPTKEEENSRPLLFAESCERCGGCSEQKLGTFRPGLTSNNNLSTNPGSSRSSAVPLFDLFRQGQAQPVHHIIISVML